ncbi:hypothetical protein Tco_1173362 [Tanacetum coccineum]
MPRGPRPSMQDLYDRMDNMEIQQGTLERMARRQLYHIDRYVGLFEHMSGHYGYTCREPMHHQVMARSSRMMRSSVEMTEYNHISLNDGVERNEEWDTPEYHDTSDSGKKAKAFTFYRMETGDISERYDAPCFVNSLEAYDGEIILEHDKNLISNEFVVKLCLEHEVKNGEKVVKNELIVALRGEIYFVKFIINPEEEDIKPGVVLGRSFLRLTKGIVDFGNGIITIYPNPKFSNDDDSDKANDSEDDWDFILEGIDFGDI